ncbi:S24 family peptidase [uncultured Lactobacillus sp.]|uniref:S24 family peptidase n=1 Tax=uncultured Lactobacillus sp. TaxID=153152 RepID=UPI0025CC2F13|nr:S24 family peptidase [uncultured Lactobacillus sp.]
MEDLLKYAFDHVPSNKLFMLYCKGNFMKPLIPYGSLITLVRKSTCENADLTVVLIDEATIKHVKLVEDKVILISENNDYYSFVLNKDKPEKFLGKVIHVKYNIQ